MKRVARNIAIAYWGRGGADKLYASFAVTPLGR